MPRSTRLRDGLPAGFAGWDPLERAAWLEVTTLLEPYLLAAQGDRVAMAHGVEGRYPFLDHRVYAYSVGLGAEEKLTDDEDKIALRRLADELLPPSIVGRRKQPYRAPEVTPFFSASSPAWVEEMLSPSSLDRGRHLGSPRGSRACCDAAARAGRPACARGWR